MFKTIAAISSAPINQPIAIIRISGDDAFKVVKKIFKGKVGLHQQVTHGYIYDQNQKVDEVLVAWYHQPNSFTGQNLVEIMAHGGVVNMQRILTLIISQENVRLANRGEFTFRAFLNKKIDLIKAQAIHDLIFAKTEEQAKLSVKKFDGKTSLLINNLLNELLTIISICEINIDYPEYDDIEQLTTQTLLPKLEILKNQLKKIQTISTSSRFIFEGINVVIIGKPNSGKSSLFNALLGQNKAIVSSQEGTTRDVVEGQIKIKQVLLKLNDTAGISLTSDLLEKKGIEKTWETLNQADLILHVIDLTNTQNELDQKIASKIKNSIYLKVFNKVDLVDQNKICQNKICISAKNLKIEPLYQALESQFKTINLNNQYILNNLFQIDLINQSYRAIRNAIISLKKGQTPDVVIVDLHQAWTALANIVGKVKDQQLLDQMFTNFCLGK